MSEDELLEAQFQSFLLHEDELGSVIRCHIILERTLTDFITALTASESSLKRLGLDYSGRVNLAAVLGLSEEFVKPLEAIGSMRNKYAHQHGFKMSKNDSDNLYKALSAAQKELVLSAYDVTRQRGEPLGEFKQLLPRDKFILIAISLRQGLRVAVRQATAISEEPGAAG